jgi:hypothetical protein
VARNRITDLFRKKKPETFSHASVADEDGELLQTEDLLPSPDAGRERSDKKSAAAAASTKRSNWKSKPFIKRRRLPLYAGRGR